MYLHGCQMMAMVIGPMKQKKDSSIFVCVLLPIKNVELKLIISPNAFFKSIVICFPFRCQIIFYCDIILIVEV